MTGVIPSLSGLTALEYFYASGNQLTGSIPSLSGLTALQGFYVINNQLTGPVPAPPSSLLASSSNLCSNSLVSSGNPSIDATWDTAQGGSWLACQLAVADTTPPVATAASVSYPENQLAGIVLATATATDNLGVSSFAIVSGNSGGFFSIDSAGGISLTNTGAASPANDFESLPNSTTLGVTAMDAAGNQSAAVNYVLNEMDVNDTVLYTLSVAKSGAGSGTVKSDDGGSINCGATCSSSYTSGAIVYLIATPAPGSAFTGWSGVCTGTGVCPVTLDAAKQVTAAFDLVSLTVTTTGVGDDGIITDTFATVKTTITVDPADIGQTRSVFITALVPASFLETLVAQQTADRRFKAMAQMAAANPDTLILVQLTPTGWQQVVNGQLIPFSTGVLTEQLAALTILDNRDTTHLIGSQFCAGYGIDASNVKMQLIAFKPDPNSTNTNTGTCLLTPWSVSSNEVNAQDAILQFVLTPDWTERNGSHNLYVAGLFEGNWYFATWQGPVMDIVRWTGDGAFPVYSVADGAEMPTKTWTIPLGDLTPYHGLQIYTGFGRSEGDMLGKGLYELIFNVD